MAEPPQKRGRSEADRESDGESAAAELARIEIPLTGEGAATRQADHLRRMDQYFESVLQNEEKIRESGILPQISSGKGRMNQFDQVLDRIVRSTRW